jgi:AraC family transcriptional regulator, transcriptional activator of pobA
MNKKMDLNTFDVYTYIKANHSSNSDTRYVLVDHLTYQKASIRFPFRNFFHGIGILYGSGGSFQVGSQEHPMQNGSLITTGPGIVSQWKQDTPHVPADTILFREDFLSSFVNASFLSSLSFFLPGGNHVITLDEENTEKIKRLFQTLKYFKDEPDVVVGLIYSLLMLVRKLHAGEESRLTTTYSIRETLIRNFHRLVAQQFLAKKDVAYYACLLNVTPKYLSEVLMAQTGRSAKMVIDDTVFLEAKSLLHQTSMSVQQICHHLGYVDTSYFTKAFKNREGCTPSAYQKQGAGL